MHRLLALFVFLAQTTLLLASGIAVTRILPPPPPEAVIKADQALAKSEAQAEFVSFGRLH